jgi:hypothetical protein
MLPRPLRLFYNQAVGGAARDLLAACERQPDYVVQSFLAGTSAVGFSGML